MYPKTLYLSQIFFVIRFIHYTCDKVHQVMQIYMWFYNVSPFFLLQLFICTTIFFCYNSISISYIKEKFSLICYNLSLDMQIIILIILCNIHDFTFISTSFYQFKISIFHNSSHINLHLITCLYLINPNTIPLLTKHATCLSNPATELKVYLTQAWDEAQGKKAIQIIKDGILMPALEDATAHQTALILTFKILLCNINKILLTPKDPFETLLSNPPQNI